MYHAAASFLSNCLLQFSKRETMWIHLKALFKIIIAQDEVRDYSLANKRIEITRWRDNFDQYNEIKESFWVYRVINSYRACVTDIINVCKTMLPVSVLGPQQTQQITRSAFRISFHLWTGKLTMAFLTGQSFLKPGTKVATKNNDFGVVLPMDLTRVTVKPSQAYPPRFYQWIDYLKNESVSRSRNWCQIQSGISTCVMSS